MWSAALKSSSRSASQASASALRSRHVSVPMPRRFLQTSAHGSPSSSAVQDDYVPGSASSSRSNANEQSQGQASTSHSLFDPENDTWEHIFSGVEQSNAAQQSASSRTALAGGSKPRRQMMTVRERSVFDEMFGLLFDAASSNTSAAPSREMRESGIGAVKRPVDEVDDLFGRLRSYSKDPKWTSEEDEELDRKKADMDMCDTDQQLLEWAMREVFDESKRYEEEARAALSNPTSPSNKKIIHLQPPSYPHLIAELMRKFRDKYSDPHLALSVFEHARHLSTVSYVFGCTTPVYNELIETRWACFRDLRGVCDAFEEMRVNGIEMDNRTRALAESIRKEVGERNVWEEEMSLGSGEVWQMMSFIDKATAVSTGSSSTSTGSATRSETAFKDPKARKGKKKWGRSSEVWKSQALESVDDSWEFGNWDIPARA